MTHFIPSLNASLADNSFVKLTLGGYAGTEADLKKIDIRRVIIKREDKLSFTYHYKTRDIVKNYAPSEAVSKIEGFLTQCRHVRLMTTGFDLMLEHGKLKKMPATQTSAPPATHDRTKHRHVAPGRPYLHALGITDHTGNVLKSAQDKYKQIDKYIEIIDGLLKHIPHEKIKHIADMGAGKGTLTFALYDYLKNTLGIDVHVSGVETRADMVTLCNQTAAAAQLHNLTFVHNTIKDYDATGVNILIALHACDTATDDAIAKGVQAGAELIVVAPCCHKQIRREMDAAKESAKDSNALGDVLRHGIYRERMAEMVTDSLRALLLEYAGYNVKVFEFIDGEHTPKNVMITATRSGTGKKAEILDKITALKAFFGISTHALEKHLISDY